MDSYSHSNILGTVISEGTEKSGLFKGSKWRIHENGIAVGERSILWDDIEQLFFSATSYSVNFINTGSSFSLTMVDYRGSEIKLTIDSSVFNRGKKSNEFSSIYNHILSHIFQRQWQKLIESIKKGQRVSFKEFEISYDGIYCIKKRLFGTKYEKLEPKSILGSTIRNGVYYIRFLNDKAKKMEFWIGPIKNIPNLHIAQEYFKKLNSTYLKKV
ncbi:hypothetical protein ACFLTT_00180 [Chloroflexota bacterium]